VSRDDERNDPRIAFVGQVAAIAEELGIFDEVLRDVGRFAVIVRRDDDLHHCALDNLWLATREVEADDRVREVGQWLDVMTRPHRPPETWEAAQDQLRPVLRTPGMFASPGLETRRDEYVVRPVTGMLRATLALDLPGRIAWVRAAQLAEWGVSETLAEQIALANIAEVAGEGVEPFDMGGTHPAWQVSSDDGYEISRLLLPGWLASFEGKVHGNPIAAVPHRNALIVTGDGEPRDIERLAGVARAWYESAPGPISPALYRVADDGEGIAELELPPDHEAAPLVRAGHVELLASEYEGQRQVLDELGVEAAPIEVWRRRAAGTVTYVTGTRWTQGATALLPEVDVVRLLDDDQERQVGWDRLREDWPTALEEVDGYDPPRWRPMGWPEE